jgi:hypothetical protein
MCSLFGALTCTLWLWARNNKLQKGAVEQEVHQSRWSYNAPAAARARVAVSRQPLARTRTVTFELITLEAVTWTFNSGVFRIDTK